MGYAGAFYCRVFRGVPSPARYQPFGLARWLLADFRLCDDDSRRVCPRSGSGSGARVERARNRVGHGGQLAAFNARYYRSARPSADARPEQIRPAAEKTPIVGARAGSFAFRNMLTSCHNYI